MTRPLAGDAEPVLALRAIGLGDALTGVPALRGLRRRFAPRPLLLAAPAALGRWMTDLDVVDGYVPTRDLDDQPPGLALGPHDAVDLHGNGPLSRDLLTAARPGQVLSFAPPDPAAEVPQTWVEWMPGEHEVHRWIRLVEAWGAEATPDDLRLQPRPQAPRAGRGRVIVHPGAAYGSRRWPVDRFAQVAQALAERGHDVVITGGPAERALCAQVAERAGLPATASTAGSLELPQLAGLVRDAALVVCGDTGIAHLATALAVPSVLLFGPVAPSAWGPAIDLDLHTVLWHGDGTGDPHGAEPDPHLVQITPDEVLAAADEHLVHHVHA
ncbi:MAG TPA: glycosyltransferase family 9 protein [Angustibacter sp.]|nr:glycosyltransferase family 9 protein [Angustibacter sp.]